ncbi:sporulation membrane protein YtaF [Alicyclobacillus pomorum]|jgi:putative sporulation protein YtaF|uniref:sporulation membrane protein YtaF n=1 Tax=Alicyclobacillus pomorum TaxID=204470 RepID=UPI00040839E8|nr:sporulation membrane protein YtaF [Alicyclobacillus pomorum]
MGSIIITIVAIAVASNLDNAGVGIAYGARGITISWVANALIAGISGAATYLAGAVGDTMTQYVEPRYAILTGGTVMLLVGIWVLLEPWRRRCPKRSSDKSQSTQNVVTRILQDPVEADFDRSQTISIKEALVLGIALALNALAGGFDAGAVHIGVLETALAVAVCSYLLLGISAYLGRKYAANTLGDKATYVAGLLLMFIGFHQIW